MTRIGLYALFLTAGAFYTTQARAQEAPRLQLERASAHTTELRALQLQYAQYSEVLPAVLIFGGVTGIVTGTASAFMNALCQATDGECAGSLVPGLLLGGGLTSLAAGILVGLVGRAEHRALGVQIELLRTQLRAREFNIAWEITATSTGAMAHVTSNF